MISPIILLYKMQQIVFNYSKQTRMPNKYLFSTMTGKTKTGENRNIVFQSTLKK